MMYFLLVIGAVAVATIIYAILKALTINRHWSNHGIPSKKPLPFFGNMFDLFFKIRTHADILKEICEEFPKEPVIGYYYFLSPRLIIKDLDLVERVFIKDFQNFVDRAPPVPIKDNPLVVNLFALSGNTWRAIRTKFSPMFTTGKLRFMFPQVSKIADELMTLLENKKVDVDMREETGKFAMEVIGSCVFGIDPGTLTDDSENEFRKEARLAFEPSFLDFVKMTMLITMPTLAKKLNLTFTPKRTIKYFSNIVRQALEHRKTTEFVRRDFVQLMVTLQEKGYIEVEKNDPNDDYLNIDDKSFDVGDTKLELTDDVMVGQAFVFLVAGFEATASTMSFMCMEFALNPECQEKARDEVVKVLKNNKEMTYDVVKDMRYLDACVKETLRLHAPVGQLIRMCVKKYRVPGTNLELNHGDFIMVPSHAIHMDPDIYQEPEKFIPERWNVTESVKRPSCSYLPFGEGPRMCIGMRFAIMEIKCCLAKILLGYKIKKNPSLESPVKINPHSFFGSPLKPILCNLEKL